jgi:transposase
MQGREENKMTQKQTSNAHLNGTAAIQRVDPEVVPKAKRRNFTANYKSWVLEEADKCRDAPGRIGALLRREGLYSSHLTTWRRQREAGQLAGLTPQKRGRKIDATAAEVDRLKRENERLERQMAQAELIIEAQKKVSEILALTLQTGKGKS